MSIDVGSFIGTQVGVAIKYAETVARAKGVLALAEAEGAAEWHGCDFYIGEARTLGSACEAILGFLAQTAKNLH